MTDELLPCPFCGGEAHYGCNVDPVDAWWVECMNPECWAAVKAVSSKEESAEIWNKRSDHSQKMDRPKMAFMEWLRVYECDVTRHWDRLDVRECDTLGEVQWLEFMKEYELFTGKRQREDINGNQE